MTGARLPDHVRWVGTDESCEFNDTPMVRHPRRIEHWQRVERRSTVMRISASSCQETRTVGSRRDAPRQHETAGERVVSTAGSLAVAAVFGGAKGGTVGLRR